MSNPKFDEMGFYKKDEVVKVDYTPPAEPWTKTTVNFKQKYGNWIYSSKAKALERLNFPNPREWSPEDDDWKLPSNWQEIVLEGMAERLKKFRTFQIFMDCCVRCGACADKCHFYIGGGDPKNMPVLRAELLRSVYRREFTKAGKILGSIAGGRELTMDVMKEWFYYFYQCTECRRCSVFCPYGIDTAEITMMARELMNLIGLSVNWVMDPVQNCNRTGNHLGIQPHGLKDTLEFFADDIEDVTGIRVDIPLNKKGAEILFVTPSGDFLADPGIFTCMGYMLIFQELGLDFTWSTYASEGGNFGLFTSNEMMKKLNGKIYAEAKRLGVKYIIGGECGHMWRVMHQYMDTMNGPADFMEVPVSPITGTRFEHARSTKMIHLVEFLADIFKNKPEALPVDKSRNDHLKVTFHDSCNTARGMGILEEPRFVLKQVCNNFVDMPDNTIREETFCCGGGAGLGTDENMEQRIRGGMPRGHALKYVQDKHGVNMMAAMCAIDRATLVTVADYWAPGVGITGISELVANAMICKGGKKRTEDMRGEELPGVEQDEEGGDDE